jgi:predicted P-loop ATPase
VITSQSDNYRGMWAEGHEKHARQCIFVGGTNSDSWQTDSTGARRFLPVRVNSEIDAEGVTAVRDELFAEAMTWVANGTTGKWWSIPNAIEHQEASYVGDPWETPIHAMLAQIIKDAPLEFPPVEPETTTYDALFSCLNIDKGKQTRSDQMRVSAIFKRAGWERKQLTGGGWCYRPKKK